MLGLLFALFCSLAAGQVIYSIDSGENPDSKPCVASSPHTGKSYGGSSGGYGYASTPTVRAPPPSVSPDEPCIQLSDAKVTTWKNGDEDLTYYLYSVDLTNSCPVLMDAYYVRMNPLDRIQQYWNIELYGKDGSTAGVFMLPEWARAYGLSPGQIMNFGWIADGEVAYTKYPDFNESGLEP